MDRAKLADRLRAAGRRDLWISVGPPLLVIVAAFVVAWLYVEPAPPQSLVLAAPSDEGGAKYYAKRYKEILARHGVRLEVRATGGSAENLRLLTDPDSGVDAAFVQSSAVTPTQDEAVLSLGAVSYVPLWVFQRGEPLDDPGRLRGKRIAVGGLDSSTRALAVQLLRATGADAAPTQLLPLERAVAIEKLKAGEIDAMFTVAPAEAPAIQKLAATPGIALMSFARAEAYARKFPQLSKLTLPRGVFDLARDVPDRDVVLLAPTAGLVARDGLHSALAYLLMRAAREVHGSAGLLDKAGEFPALVDAGLPPAEEAKRFYEAGVPLSQRYLPFWAANLVERLWVMLLPVVAVLLPVLRLIPPIYRWRVRSRIYRWYGRLKEIELELDEGPNRPELERMLVRLDDIENAVHHIPTPLAYAEHLYVFREHIDLLRRRIDGRLAGSALGQGQVHVQVRQAG